MIDTAIKIDDREWRGWLSALGQAHEFGGMECDAGLFEDEEFLAAVKAGGVRCTHARNLVPEDVPGLLRLASENHSLPQLYTRIYDAMKSAAQVGDVQSFSMPFRLDRLEDDAAQTPQLATFLSRLLFAPVDHAFNVLIPVRLPRPFPQSEEIARAVEICRIAREAPADSSLDGDWVPSHARSAIKNGIASICLHLYPEEGILPEFESADLSSLEPFLGLVCFHYNVTAGETLFDDEQAAWANRLKERGFPGTVVFCPDECPAHLIPEVIEHARQWASLYLPTEDNAQE